MSSNYNINGLIEGIKDVCIDKGIDWIITAIITYFSARYATRCYYDKTRVMVAKNTMEQGLRALLKLTCDEKLPDNAKVIFVEYKGRCWDIRKCKKEESDCHFGGRIRKTVAAVGGDIMGISAFKPRDYGVLGLANELGKPVLFNFQNGKLYKYDNGKFIKLETEEYNGKYVYVLKNYRKELSPIETARDVMIAVPIAANGKLLGGVTFDMHIGAKTIYQNVNENDSEKIKAQKKQNNIKVMQEVVRTANNLIDAYFKKKGEDI